MEDIQIIDLYFARDEAAIAETARKYGRFCSSAALSCLCVCASGAGHGSNFYSLKL